MPLIAAGIGGVASLAGGIIGGNAQKKAAAAQQQAIAAAMAQAQAIIDAVGAPPDLSEKIILNQFAQAGILTPELEEQVKIGVSNLAKIEQDKQSRDVQVKALQEMSKRGKAGLTAEERAEYNKSRQGVQADLQAKQDQIKNDLAMRGQGGSGAEIAQRLLSSQAAADRASEESDRIQATASQRALQAITASSDMAGSLRAQDFGEESAKAAAQDEFDRFNVANQIAINQRNVGSKNAAAAANLGEKQRAQDTNTGNANNELYRQSQAKRDFWSDKMRQAEARIAPITGMVGQQNAATAAAGNASANMATGIGSGVSSIFGSLANYYAKSPSSNVSSVGSGGTPVSDDLQAQFNAMKKY